MNEQIINDFWKEKIILLQRQNSRLLKPLENLSKAEEKIYEIQNKFYAFKYDLEKSETSLSWTLTLSTDFQIRLFLQRQSKLTFLGKSASNFEKIADVKLFNEPFDQIEHFLNHFSEYKNELEKISENEQKSEKKMQIAFEFLNAILEKKYLPQKKEFSIEKNKNSFSVTIKNNSVEEKFEIAPENVTDLC